MATIAGARDIIAQAIKDAARLYPSPDWAYLYIRARPMADNIALTEWDADGACTITLSEDIKTQTELLETLAHELAHYILGELDTKTHNTKTHGKAWFNIYARLQVALIWRRYYPNDWT